MNNGATNVYFVLILSYIANFGNAVLGLAMLFASFMVTGMRVFDAITDPIIGALMDKTNTRFGKFRPFMVIGNGIMAISVLLLYVVTPLVHESMMWLRCTLFITLYAVLVIGHTFPKPRYKKCTSCIDKRPQATSALYSFQHHWLACWYGYYANCGNGYGVGFLCRGLQRKVICYYDLYRHCDFNHPYHARHHRHCRKI